MESTGTGLARRGEESYRCIEMGKRFSSAPYTNLPCHHTHSVVGSKRWRGSGVPQQEKEDHSSGLEIQLYILQDPWCPGQILRSLIWEERLFFNVLFLQKDEFVIVYFHAS